MEKVKKYLKWPALAISALLFVVFTIVLIATCAKKFSKSVYIYEESMAGAGIKMEITLNKDNTGTMDMTASYAGEVEFTSSEFNYRIIDGVLFVAEIGDPDYERIGEINAFEITMANEETPGIAMVAENASAKATKTASIVIMCVFGVAALASGAYIYLDTKKKTEEKPSVVIVSGDNTTDAQN